MLRGVVRGVPDRRPRTVRRMFRLPVGIPTDIIQRASGLTMRKNCLAKRSRGSGRARAVRKSLIGFLLLTVLRRRSLAAAESTYADFVRAGPKLLRAAAHVENDGLASTSPVLLTPEIVVVEH